MAYFAGGGESQRAAPRYGRRSTPRRDSGSRGYGGQQQQQFAAPPRPQQHAGGGGGVSRRDQVYAQKRARFLQAKRAGRQASGHVSLPPGAAGSGGRPPAMTRRPSFTDRTSSRAPDSLESFASSGRGRPPSHPSSRGGTHAGGSAMAAAAPSTASRGGYGGSHPTQGYNNPRGAQAGAQRAAPAPQSRAPAAGTTRRDQVWEEKRRARAARKAGGGGGARSAAAARFSPITAPATGGLNGATQGTARAPPASFNSQPSASRGMGGGGGASYGSSATYDNRGSSTSRSRGSAYNGGGGGYDRSRGSGGSAAYGAQQQQQQPSYSRAQHSQRGGGGGGYGGGAAGGRGSSRGGSSYGGQTSRTTVSVAQPPGGSSSFSLGWG